MKRNNLVILLPAYNGAESIKANLSSLREDLKIEGFPWMDEIDIIPIVLDDGSLDDTAEASVRMLNAAYVTGAVKDALVYRTDHNISLSEVLKRGYQIALNYGTHHVLKTDVDFDFSFKEVIQQFVPRVFSDPQFGVSRRERAFDTEHPEYGKTQAYEKKRWEDVMKLMEEHYPGYPIDPSTCGTQLLRHDIVYNLIQDARFRHYDKPWGLDFLVALMYPEVTVPDIVFEGHPVEFGLNLFEGKFDPARRPYDKVKAQYDTYIEIIGMMKGKDPQDLSGLYGA